MRIQQLMTRDVRTCRRSDGLDTAARIMKDHDCGSAVVVDDDGNPVAMITDRDICMIALKAGVPLKALKVSDAMSSSLYTCRPEDPVSSAEETMALKQVRRLPVVDRCGSLVGILSLDDIAREGAREPDIFKAPVTAREVGRTLGTVARRRAPSPRSDGGTTPTPVRPDEP